MKQIRLKAMAKVNLSLDVLRRREDGYHEVRMIMQSVNLYDKLFIAESEEPGIRLTTNRSFLPTGPDNLVYRAADLLDVTEPFPLEQDENIGVLYKFEPEPEPFTIRNLGNGQWVVEGDEINRLFSRTDFENEQQVMQFGIALRKMGVDAALREKGIREKDTVFINDFGFEFTDMDEE